MSEWVNARWTQARQIVELSDPDAARALPDAVSPEQHFAALVDTGRQAEATTFLGLALPRLEGIAWAFEVLKATHAAPDSHAVRAEIASWLDDPSDTRRRRVSDLADTLGDGTAERLLAHAVFLSGGSIAPVDLPSVNPSPELSGRLAAAAVMKAAHLDDDPEETLGRALRLGDSIARNRKR